MQYGNHNNGRSMNELSKPRQALPRVAGRVILYAGASVADCAVELRRRLEADGGAVTEIDVSAIDPTEAEIPFGGDPVQGAVCLALAGYANTLLGLCDGAGAAALEAALRSGAPLVVAPGELDSIRFGARATLPPQYTRRLLHEVSPTETWVRTNVVESAQLGRQLADQINRAAGPVAVCLPLRGLSRLDAPGQPFYQMEVSMALFGNLTTHLRHDIRIYNCNVNINAPTFARLCHETLEVLMTKVDG